MKKYRDPLAIIFLVLSTIFFLIASVQDVFVSTPIKNSVDILRLLFIILYFIFSCKDVRLGMMDIPLIFIMIVSIVWGDTFTFQSIVGAYISKVAFRRGPQHYLITCAWFMLFSIWLIMTLSMTGYISSQITYNPLGENFSLGVVNKNSWGFWHPNVFSLFLVGVIITAHYFNRKILFVFSLITYAFVVEGTASRTYMIVPIWLSLYWIVSFSGLFVERIYTLGLVLSGTFALLLSIIFIYPRFLLSIIGIRYFEFLDVLLSLRLSIALSVSEDLSFSQYLFGDKSGDILIDSFYFNILLRNGFIVYLFLAMVMFIGLIRAYRNGLNAELFVLSLVYIIMNFEVVSGMNSLLWLLVCVCFYKIHYYKLKVSDVSLPSLVFRKIRCHGR